MVLMAFAHEFTFCMHYHAGAWERVAHEIILIRVIRRSD